MSEARSIALEAIIDILERNKFADDVLSSVLDNHKLKRKDRSLVTELIYGVTRQKLTLDYLLSKVSKKELNQLSFNIRNILRLAVYQLEYTRIPEYAAVNSAVEMTKTIESYKASSFVNGVLRNLVKKRKQIKFPKMSKNTDYALSIRYSHPQWLVKKWLDVYGLDSTIGLLSFNNMPSQTTINVNTNKSSIKEVTKELKENNINPTQSQISPTCLKLGNVGAVIKLPGYYEGHWFVQDEVSSLVVDILDPKPDDFIIDFCSAPGVKTVQIANKMENKGKIIAIDISETRLNKIKENCYRLSATNIETITADASKFVYEGKKLADKILIDAPCSNTGVLSKRADARWQRKPKDIETLSNLQYNILKNATKSLKPKGTLVYSVCSIEPEEGIDLVKKFLSEHHNFKIIDPANLLPANLEDTCTEGYIQFLPFKHLTDGFFVACLKKLKES